VRLEARGVVVEDLDALDLDVAAARRQLLLGVEDAVERRLDVPRGEGSAVVEPHAWAQLDLPGGVVEVLPRGGETRADLARLEIARRKVVEDVIAEDDGLAEHGVRRVPVLHVRLYRVHDRVGLRLRRRDGRQRDDEYQEREDGEASRAHGVLHQGGESRIDRPRSGAHDAAKARRVSNATIAAWRTCFS